MGKKSDKKNKPANICVAEPDEYSPASDPSLIRVASPGKTGGIRVVEPGDEIVEVEVEVTVDIKVPTTDQLTMKLIQTLKQRLDAALERVDEVEHKYDGLEIERDALQTRVEELEKSYNVETLIEGLKPLLVPLLKA